MSLSAVQVSNMAVKMATASDMGDSGQGGCCGGGDDGNISAGNCMPICTNSAAAIVPSDIVVTATVVADPPVPGNPRPRGRMASPEPYPPRPAGLV